MEREVEKCGFWGNGSIKDQKLNMFGVKWVFDRFAGEAGSVQYDRSKNGNVKPAKPMPVAAAAAGDWERVSVFFRWWVLDCHRLADWMTTESAQLPDGDVNFGNEREGIATRIRSEPWFMIVGKERVARHEFSLYLSLSLPLPQERNEKVTRYFRTDHLHVAFFFRRREFFFPPGEKRARGGSVRECESLPSPFFLPLFLWEKLSDRCVPTAFSSFQTNFSRSFSRVSSSSSSSSPPSCFCVLCSDTLRLCLCVSFLFGFHFRFFPYEAKYVFS